MTEEENCGWEELAHDALDWVIATGDCFGSFLGYFGYLLWVPGSLAQVIFWVLFVGNLAIVTGICWHFFAGTLGTFLWIFG